MGELTPIISVRIASEQDIVVARQRARDLARHLGLAPQDQVALATADSEMARNVYQYARQGDVEFRMDLKSRPQFFSIRVQDEGPGIADLENVLDGRVKSQTGMGVGLMGTRRLTERFDITSKKGQGTCVVFGKSRPSHLEPIDTYVLGNIAARLGQTPPPTGAEELRNTERELRDSLQQLQTREDDLKRRTEDLTRLSIELEETNRGVVALYAELEERAAALRRADELKSRFLSHVSHEFRTPVNSVTALTRLLLRRTDGDLTPEQEKQVQFINKAAEGLTEMVDDLLDLAKMEAGKIELRPHVFELGQASAPCAPLCVRSRRTMPSHWSWWILRPVSISGRIKANSGRSFRNLVSNALKFTEAGEVRVQASYEPQSDIVTIRSFRHRHWPRAGRPGIYFPGILADHSSSPTQSERHRVGLPLSRKLAELMGGTLTVKSKLGEGSTFTLRLQSRLHASPEPASEPAQADSTILIVDDEEAARYVCSRMFRGSRHRMIEASALDAAERARFERPDLIILDLMMPGRTGFEVLDDLKSHSSTAEIPVIIHTSKVITPADRQRLGQRPVAILPKSGPDRRQALESIRTILHDKTLFVGEPEFDGDAGETHL